MTDLIIKKLPYDLTSSKIRMKILSKNTTTFLACMTYVCSNQSTGLNISFLAPFDKPLAGSSLEAIAWWFGLTSWKETHQG